MINKKLVTNGSIFLASNLLNALIPFLLLPVLTRVLTPEDYGIVAMFTIFLTLTSAFVGMSVHGAINVQYFKLEADEFSEYVTSCIMVLISSALVVFLVVFLVGGYFEKVVGIPHKWMLIAVLVSFFQFFTTIHLSIWVITGEAFKYGLLQVSQTLINVTLSVFLILIIGLMWEGRLFGQTIAIIIFGLISLFLIHKSGYLRYPKHTTYYMKDALKFGIPLIPHTIGAFVIYSTDRVVVSNLLGVSTVGVYMVALQLGKVMGLLSTSFNKVYSPWLMKNLSDGNLDKKKVVFYSYMSMLALLLAGITWFIISNLLLPYIVGIKFQESAHILIYMCLGSAFTGLYYIVTNYIFYAKKTKLLAGVTFFCGFLNIPLTYYLVSLYGLTGAAIAFLIIQILFFVLTWILAAKVFPMPWFYFLKGKENA